MNAFVRFQTHLPCWRTRRPLGIFAAAGDVQDLPDLDRDVRTRLETSLAWFNRSLAVPDLPSHGWRCLFWFRSDAHDVISRIWDLAAVLNETGVNVSMLWTRRPGRIVYTDQHQIAAVPHSRR